MRGGHMKKHSLVMGDDWTGGSRERRSLSLGEPGDGGMERKELPREIIWR